VPRHGGPLGCMLNEHDEGRAFIQAMKQNAPGCANGDTAGRRAWVAAARGYAHLLRNHIWKENEILFQIAERLLTEAEQAELAKEFDKVQCEKLDGETQSKLRQFKLKMEKEYAAAAPR